MKIIYYEFLNGLYMALLNLEETWWTSRIKRCIDKYNINEDLTDFLSNFGGMGSFNDENFKSEVTEVLQTITYTLANNINNNTEIKLEDILLDSRKRYDYNVRYWQKQIDAWPKEEEINSSVKKIKYIEYLLENYKIGELHKLTEEYLNTSKLLKR